MDESEYTSEYILDIPDDQSEKVNVSENKSKNDNSKNQINSKQTDISPKSEPPKKISLPLTNSPNSLLVHPNKSQQQSSNNNNKQKNLEESETASEHVLEAPDDSEKAIFPKRFVLANNQGRKSVQSKQPEKVNPIKLPNKTPSSSLSNPSPNKNQSKIQYNRKLTEKSKCKQETPDKQSEKIIFTKRFVLADNQPQINIQSRQQENQRQPIKVSNSSLSNPNKNQNVKSDEINHEESVYVLSIQDEQPEKFTTHCEQPEKFTTHCEQTEKKGNSNDQEDKEFSSDCILEELEEKTENWNKSEYNEFASSSEISFNSSQSNTIMKSKQIGKVDLDKTQSSLLNKIKQQSITKDDQTNIDESELSTADDQSEKAIATEKFLIANIQLQEIINLKKFEKVGQQDSSEKMPCSMLSCQDKNDEQPKTKSNQNTTEESEYILKMPEEQIGKPIVTGKSSNQSTECTQSIQPGKIEQTKSAIQKSSSLSLHINKSDEQSKTKCNQKVTKESEYILKIPEEQIEKPINQSTGCNKSNHPRKIEQSPINSHCSFLLHQHKDQNQSNMKCYRKLTEESEVTSEYILEEPANDQFRKNVAKKKLVLSSNQKQETAEQPIPSEKTPCSISAHPNKNHEQISTKISQKETEESEFESEKAIITQKFLLCNLQTQQDLSTSQADENIKSAISSEVSYSQQVPPNKINYHPIEYKEEREKCEIKMKSQSNQVVKEPTKYVINETKNEIEQKNQVVVDEQNKTQQKKKPFVSTYDPSIFYNDSVDITRCTFEFQNQSINDNVDASTLNKSSQHLFIKINKANIDESEYTSEYILKMPNEQPEKATATEKSKENAKSKQQEKVSPSKSPVKKPDSPLSAHPNKSRQRIFRKNNQTSIKESENACEFRLEMPNEEEPSKSPTKKIDSLSIQAEKNIKQPNIKRNQINIEEHENASEYILKVPNEQQEKVNLTETFILPIDQSKENTKSKQQEKSEQSKSPTKTTNSFPIKPENNQKTSIIKRNQKSVEESEYASEYILKVPNEQQEKVNLTETFILPIDQPKENTKSKQPEKLEQSKSPTKTPYSLPIQTEKNRKPSDIKRNQKAADESEFVTEYILVIPEEQSAKTETIKKFILLNDQELQNKISKQPAKAELLPKSSNKNSYSSLMLQGKSKQQKNQEECVCEYILEIPEEQTEKAIETKKSTQSKDQTSLLSINNTKNLLQMKQNRNKSEISTQFNRLNIQKEQVNEETVDDKLNKNLNLTEKNEPTKQSIETSCSIAKINQQPINQEPQISPQHHLIELEEQIEKWCRSEYLEFASSSEKIFNSSLSSINPKLTQTDKVEQIKIAAKPSCSLIEIPNETRLQAITKDDDDLLPETTEESYSEKTIVTPKFLLCKLKTQQNFNTQTDEIIEPLIPSKISCSHIVLPSKANADHQCFKINFQPLSEYDDEIESEELKKETEKCQIKTSIPMNRNVIEQTHQVVKAQKNQIVNEPKNQINKTQKSKDINEQNKQVIKTQNKQAINEPKSQNNKTQKNQVINEQNKQVNKEQKNQVINEQNKQVNKEQKNQVINEQNKQVNKEQRNQVINEQAIKTKKNQVVNEEKKKSHQKKQKPFVSAYDPSIFYNETNDVSRCKFEFQKHHHNKSKAVSPLPKQMPLTVSLKDIGLEGLDSNNIEKIHEMNNKSRILIHVDRLSEKSRDKIEPNPKSEVVCKLSPYERKDKLISSIKKERIEPYFALFSLSDEQNNVVGSNLKPASLLDSTQKSQKIQAIKPKTSPKNCQKTSKSGTFSSSYDEYQLSTFVCRSPRRCKSPNNDF